MASKSVLLEVRPRGKPIRSLPDAVTLDSTAAAADLYNQLAKESKYSVHQLRVTKGSDGAVIPNAKDVTLQSTGLRNESVIHVKDLGPQIAWRTVFIVEYAGPILIYPIVYALRPYVYKNAPAEASQLQVITMYLVILHFIKRELETLFVHRFSAATMPIKNIFKNSAHYWLLAGLNIAVWTLSPSAPTAKATNTLLLYVGLAAFAIGELGNFQVHMTLRGLRSSGGAERGIPRGPLFNLVTCPNYMMETLTWIGVWLVSRLSWSVLVFAAVSVAQMAQWGKKKESRYRKEFGDKYKKKRYTMLPGLF